MKSESVSTIQEACKTSVDYLLPVLEPLRNQSVLVTGGTGFIGKWLAELTAYLNARHEYRITLYLLSRNTEAFRSAVPHLASQSFIRLIEGDVRNVSELPKDVSYVIHAAATPDRREHATQPLRVIETIYKGTLSVLNAATRLPVLNKFLYISSNNIYGTVFHGDEHIAEKSMGHLDCNSINAAYAEAKRLAETVCAVYRNQQRLPITTVRPFAFLGPYQDIEKPWALNNFMRDAILGGPIRILGNKDTVRTYLYGSDMAAWLLAVLANPKPANMYNLGSEEGVSMIELSHKIAANFHNKIDIHIKSSEESERYYSSLKPDLSELKKYVPVRQTISLEEAIKKTLTWYQENNQTIR